MTPQMPSAATLNRTATQDTAFNQTVSQALDAAFGADPATGQVLPGPISHLMDRMKGDFNRSGLDGLGGLFPEAGGGGQPGGFQSPIPPLLNGQLGGMFPGGGTLVAGQTPGVQGLGRGVTGLAAPTDAGRLNPFNSLDTASFGGHRMPAGNASHQFAPLMESGITSMLFQLGSMMLMMLQTAMQGSKGASA